MKDTEFEKILKFLLQTKGIHKKDIGRLRVFIEAVYYISKGGCQWRLLPPYYGKWRSVHKRFKDWSVRNIWQNLFEFSKDDPDMELTMVDSTIVRSHACAAGYGKNTQHCEALGRSRGGFTTKIHALVDGLGNPLKFILTPGQSADINQAYFLSDGVKNTSVLADRSYDCDAYITQLNKKNCIPVIPSRRNRIKRRFYDKFLYRERHLIECFFGKIKHFRRVFSRFDKSYRSYLSFLYFVGALIWFRQFGAQNLAHSP